MPGTLLLADLERSNSSELNDHLQSLLATPTAPGGGYDPSSLGVRPAVTIAPPEPQPVPDELQAHLDNLLTPDASQAPPAAPVPTPEPTPAPAPGPEPAAAPSTNVMDELAGHVENLTGGGLKLLGQGLNTLAQGAQQGAQSLGQGLTSLREPRTLPSSAVSAPGPGVPTPQAGPGPSGPLQDYARQAATRAGIDPDIFVRQIQQESGFNPRSASPAGAQGIAQIVPRYHPGVDTSDPYASLDYAANLMRSHLGRYGGDYSKALAAYNAGPGAVERYGGVPPFEETQRYVSTILGGGQPRGAAPTPAEGVARAGGALGQANRDVSQFGDSQLTADEATAACGPAAAVRFAQRFGRNPTLREATDLAKTVGWTSAQGMAGLSSEKALMDKMGVATKLVSGADWGTFANEARTGNPVTISTEGHYFTADGWDPATNRFHVGRSGLDLRGGSEWMTPEQMTSIMGAVQGGLLADNPTVPASTVGKTDGFTAPGDGVMQAASTGLRSIGEGLSSLGEQAGLRSLDQAVDASSRPAVVPGQGYDPSAFRAAESPGEGIPFKQDVRDLGIPSQPTIFEDPTQIPGILRGPALTTDQELLDRAGPEGIAAARQLAQVGQVGPKREPTDAEISDTLRSMSLGEAYAGTHTGGAAKLNLDQLAEMRAQVRHATAQPPPPPGSPERADWLQGTGKWAPPSPTADSSTLDKAVAVGINGMLSPTTSFFTNLAGLAENVKRPVVTAGTAGVEALTGRPGRALTELGAAKADFLAQGAAFADALADLGTTFRTGERPSRIAGNRDVRTEAFPGTAGMILTPNLRGMAAVDELTRGLANAGGQASEVRRLLDANPALNQQQVMDQFRERILDAGIRAGKEATYESGGTPIGPSVARMRRQFSDPNAPVGDRVAGAVMNVLVPFSSIPDVLLSRGVGRVPGINTIRTVAETAAAANRGDMAAAKRAASSGFIADAVNSAIFSQVVAGNITGNGPSDLAKKKTLMQATDANGVPLWRPNSVRIGDHWVSYSSLGPIAIQAGALANGYEQYLETGKAVNPNWAKATMSALGETVSEAWYLQSIARLFNAMKSGGLGEAGLQAGTQTAERYTAGPYSGLVNEARQFTDPTVRDPRNPAEELANRYPGLDAIVPPRIDPTTGRPMEQPRDALSLFIRGAGPGDPNRAAGVLAEHNLGVGDAPKMVTIGSGRNSVSFAITEDEQRRFQELAGSELEQRLLDFDRDPDFRRLAPEDRQKLLEQQVAKARDLAGLQLASELPAAEIDKRFEAQQAAERRQAEPGVVLPR